MGWEVSDIFYSLILVHKSLSNKICNYYGVRNTRAFGNLSIIIIFAVNRNYTLQLWKNKRSNSKKSTQCRMIKFDT